MAVKDIDARASTKGGGVVRVERWRDPKTGAVVKYNMAYVNFGIHSGDNGRVLGFDNSHPYPGFPTLHHYHWMGSVYHHGKFLSFDQTLDLFERLLKRLKQHHGKAY